MYNASDELAEPSFLFVKPIGVAGNYGRYDDTENTSSAFYVLFSWRIYILCIIPQGF